MKAGKVQLSENSTSEIIIKMSLTGLAEAEFTAKLYELLDNIKENSGIFPDSGAAIFTLPGEEKENIGRRFELDPTVGAVDPVDFSDWKVTCEVIRLSDPNVTLKVVEDEGKFNGNNLADSKIFITFI